MKRCIDCKYCKLSSKRWHIKWEYLHSLPIRLYKHYRCIKSPYLGEFEDARDRYTDCINYKRKWYVIKIDFFVDKIYK